MFNLLRLTDAINREDMVVYSVREAGRSVVRLPGLWSLHCRHRLVAQIRQETKVRITLSLFTHSGYDHHNAGRGLRALRCSNIPFMEM